LEDGLLERLAKGESALGGLPGTLEALGKDIEELDRLTQEATTEMDAADAAGKPTFASRLRIAQTLAHRLAGPAEQIEQHAGEYVSLLLDVDPMVATMLQMIGEDEKQRSSPDAAEFAASILGVAESGREGARGLNQLVRSLEDASQFSRELRKPLRRIQGSLRNVIDAQSLMEEWERKVEEIEGGSVSADAEEATDA
jgi:hypothetical protein